MLAKRCPACTAHSTSAVCRTRTRIEEVTRWQVGTARCELTTSRRCSTAASSGSTRSTTTCRARSTCSSRPPRCASRTCRSRCRCRPRPVHTAQWARI
ncbi:hypothetical protein F441_22510 [Phytophthora nicotianae CJ01A1]|uniref:Uncharacterized protein n=1 Tax=Phytophthora nicotianae CJ01A1 TaxID=1317063 RepID=W2VP87_PHYNI|nr:hypothetical protein F441_22510 [Phytophthora nicotianae CJ01A1]